MLPADATVGDLETGFALRGQNLVTCDMARKSAVETLQAERALVDRWIADARPSRRFLPF